MSKLEKLNVALYLVLVLCIILLASYAVLVGSLTRVVPTCSEDAVLVGCGDFENGRWTYYICGPAVDDFATER